MQQKILIIVISVLIIAGAAGGVYYFATKDTPQKDVTTDLFSASGGTMDDTQSTTTKVELPDVVARVNGEEITKADMEKYENQFAASQGFDLTALTPELVTQLHNQALDALMSNILIKQAKDKAGIVATDEEINAQLTTVKGQYEDDAKYQEALSGQGLTEEDLKKLIADDLAIQKYLDQTLDLKSVTATEEEIQDVYDQEASASTTTPPLADVKDQINNFVIQQKQQQKIIEHIQALMSDADIEKLF